MSFCLLAPQNADRHFQLPLAIMNHSSTFFFIFHNFILNTRVAKTVQSTPGCPSLSFPFVHILRKQEAFITSEKITSVGSNSPKHRSYAHVISFPLVPFFFSVLGSNPRDHVSFSPSCLVHLLQSMTVPQSFLEFLTLTS